VGGDLSLFWRSQLMPVCCIEEEIVEDGHILFVLR